MFPVSLKHLADLLSTFLLFYFQWRPETDGSKKFYDIIENFSKMS
jgi:hypothetical protein